MDASLLKAREAFKARALATPVVEKSAKKKESSGSGRNSPAVSKRPTPSPSPAPTFDYKTSTGSSQFKFSVLAKIVRHMKVRYQQDDNYELSLEEILDETHQTDLGTKTKVWLESEALNNNPKIVIVETPGECKKYKFKPSIPVKDRKSLLQFLDKQEAEGLGGVLMEDIEEALPYAQKAIRKLTEDNHIATVTRAQDKKLVVFHRPKGKEFKVDDEFVKLWRGVAVDGIDDGKVEEYLKKHGITSMQDVAGKKAVGKELKRKKGKQKAKIVNNEHLKNVLQDYSDKAALGGKKFDVK